MLLLLLQNCEDSGRGLVTGAAGAHGRPDQDTVAINIGSLLGDADDHDHRTGGHGFGHPQKLAFLQLSNGVSIGTEAFAPQKGTESASAGACRTTVVTLSNRQHE